MTYLTLADLKMMDDEDVTIYANNLMAEKDHMLKRMDDWSDAYIICANEYNRRVRKANQLCFINNQSDVRH
jgi:uncharacterized protein YacL (UPF0231 family)